VRSLGESKNQYLETELRAARDEMADMADPEAGSVSGSRSPGLSRASSHHSLPRRVLRLFLASTRPTSIVSGSSSDAERPLPSELEKRNETLMARIAELEGQMQSGWASEEPLPLYMA
jgi:hypothetical protein